MTPVILAAPADDGPDDLMAGIVRTIQEAGLSIQLVELDARVADDAAHEQRVRAALAGVSGGVIIGGFSLGARIAARLCPELGPVALLCFGYPFHAPKPPRGRHGLEALSRVTVPTLIIQGSRDPHGSEAEVRGYALPDVVELLWLRDGNHRFVPRARSGLSQQAHVHTAAAAAIRFIRGR